jgi:hypothetical protein
LTRPKNPRLGIAMNPIIIYRITRPKPGFQIIAFLAIAAIVAAHIWLFPLTVGVDYLSWYLSTGVFVALVVAAIDVVTEDLKDEYQLISADPVVYLYGCFAFAGLLYFSLGTTLRTDSQPPVEDSPGTLGGGTLSIIWDKLWCIVLAAIIMLGGFAWLLIYAPMNYFVQLIVAAPGRAMLRGTGYRALAVKHEDRLELTEWPRDTEPPGNAVDISLDRKPLALTQSLLAAVLLLGKVVSEWWTSGSADVALASIATW